MLKRQLESSSKGLTLVKVTFLICCPMCGLEIAIEEGFDKLLSAEYKKFVNSLRILDCLHCIVFPGMWLILSKSCLKHVKKLFKAEKYRCFYQFHKCQCCIICYFARQNNYVVRSHLSVSHADYNTFLIAVRHLFDAGGLHIMKYGQKKANQLFKRRFKICGCEYHKAQGPNLH